MKTGNIVVYGNATNTIVSEGSITIALCNSRVHGKLKMLNQVSPTPT